MNNHNVLVTGSSASGKSTLAKLLLQNGYNSIDADYAGGISYWENKITGEKKEFPEDPPLTWGLEHHWKWDLDKVKNILASNNETTFICGTSANCELAYPLFDSVIVLTASRDALASRLSSRIENSFGKQPGERVWALNENDRLVAKAHVDKHQIIDTSNTSPEDVMSKVLSLL